MPTKLAVVVAVSRPERLDSIVQLFGAQAYRDAELVLCLNGPARDAEAQGGTVLRCEGGTPARPRNAGLTYLRERGIPLAAFWDDDDYYGPGDLAEKVEALEGNPRRVVGRHARFTRFDDGLYYLLGAQGSFLGGTIAGWTSELPPIPDLPRDEDRIWCEQMARDGFDLRSLSARHYVYDRRSGEHAWQSSKLQALLAYGPSFFCGGADDSIVDGPLLGMRGDFVPRPSSEDITAELLANLMARPIEPWPLTNHELVVHESRARLVPE